MDEKDKIQQEKNKKFLEAKIKFQTICVNICTIMVCVLLLINMVHLLTQKSHTQTDYKQLLISVVMFVVFALLFGLNNFFGDELFQKFMSQIHKGYDKRNKKQLKKITDLNSALLQLSQFHGVVIWDTIWGACAGFMAVIFLAFFKTCNKPVVLGILVFLLTMLFVGHFVGMKMSRKHNFYKEVCKYTRQYIDLVDEEAYFKAVSESVTRGVLGFGAWWMLTDEYIIGRISDIFFSPVVVPRAAVKEYIAYCEKYVTAKGVPIGIIECRLVNGKSIKYVTGRGKVLTQVLLLLREQGIEWKEEEMQYL